VITIPPPKEIDIKMEKNDASSYTDLKDEEEEKNSTKDCYNFVVPKLIGYIGVLAMAKSGVEVDIGHKYIDENECTFFIV
jgi:hypothetical protein